jgi:hypothetical protein
LPEPAFAARKSVLSHGWDAGEYGKKFMKRGTPSALRIPVLIVTKSDDVIS